MADIKKIIKDLQGDFGGDNENQMKGVQLLKGLATSDDPLSNKFMKALNTAMTKISKDVLGESKKESLEEGFYKFHTADQAVDWIYLNKYSDREKKQVQQDIDKSGLAQIGDDIFIVDKYDIIDGRYIDVTALIQQRRGESKSIQLAPGQKVLDEAGNEYELEEGDSLIMQEAKTQCILDLEQDILSMEQEVKDMEDADADAEDIKAGKEELADMKQELTDEKERETE